MAVSKCFYCGKPVNRDKEKFARIHYGQVYRYAHINCYEANKEIEKRECDIVDPLDTVICAYCKKPMKKTDFDCKAINPYNTKFAHLLCIQEEAKREKTPEEELDIYIMKIFNLEFIPPNIQKQKKSYIDNHMTFSGIKGSLKYFYEIKQNKIDISNPSIGIVPYIYNEAKEYYKKLDQTRLKNKNKDLTYEGQVIKIKIQKPKRQEMRKRFFTFFDDDKEAPR